MHGGFGSTINPDECKTIKYSDVQEAYRMLNIPPVKPVVVPPEIKPVVKPVIPPCEDCDDLTVKNSYLHILGTEKAEKNGKILLKLNILAWYKIAKAIYMVQTEQ